MDIDIALSRLCNRSVAFALYADYLGGMTVSDLAQEAGRREEWVLERINSARLCLEKQVRIVIYSAAATPTAA